CFMPEDAAPAETQPESPQINILDPVYQEEIDLKLTRGQALFVYNFLEANIQPRGMAMVEFSYDMMKRFQLALEPVSEPQVAVETAEVVEETKETFVSKKTADGTTVFENNVAIKELMEE
ncbi:MAG: hypothetical protein CMG13_06345, partial [Candidatus Marinimicrobia bacterium]|nr:hypothetical protein [Candidatus Neomarinimicrobiota bacterium]